jgi:hypothetical protein
MNGGQANQGYRATGRPDLLTVCTLFAIEQAALM